MWDKVLSWDAVSFIVGIPVVGFLLDLGMRRLIRTKKLDFIDWCYGSDLGLAGITTGIACWDDLKKGDSNVTIFLLFVALGCWLMSMILHQEYEPKVDSEDDGERRMSRLKLAIGANFLGMLGLALVLLLIYAVK